MCALSLLSMFVLLLHSWQMLLTSKEQLDHSIVRFEEHNKSPPLLGALLQLNAHPLS